MKILLDGLSVIAVGGWNAQIFSPEWLKNNVCDEVGCQIELAVPINNPAAQPRLSFEGVHLYINPLRLELKPQNQKIESFANCLRFLKKILVILKHTPVNSFGINFAFMSDGDHEEIIPKFILTDNALFDAEKNNLVQTIIQRAFKQVDESILNLIISIEATNVVVSFNYHRNINNADECVARLNDETIAQYYANSLKILEDVYGVQVDTE